MRRLALVALLFAAPCLAFAAGFAKQSIFLSTGSPVEGQSVLIHASVSNPTSDKFSGTLKIHDDEGPIGEAPVSLEAGGAADVSVSWKPAAGAHTIVADLVDETGAVVEEDSQTFTVAPKVTPAQTTDNGVQPSDHIQQSLGNISPTAAQYSKPVFTMIDSGRVFAAGELRGAIDWSRRQMNATSSANTAGAPSKTARTLWTIITATMMYALSALLFVVGNAGVCYPILALLFLYMLWKFFTRYRRRY